MTRPADRRPHPRPAGRLAHPRARARSSRTARPRASASSPRPAGRASCASAWTASSWTSTTHRRLDKYKRHTHRGRRRPAHRPPRGRGRAGRSMPEHPDPDAARLADSVETALRLGEGVMLVAPADPGAFEEQRFSERYSCAYRRHDDRRARAALVLVQLAARRLPRLHGPRHPPRVRRRPHHPRPQPLDRGRRHRALAHRPHGAVVAPQDDRGGLRLPTAGTTRRPSSELPPEAVEYLLYAASAARRSRSGTGTSAARTPTSPPSRASSRTSSGATARPTRSTSAPSSRSTWSSGPAPPAVAGA